MRVARRKEAGTTATAHISLGEKLANIDVMHAMEAELRFIPSGRSWFSCKDICRSGAYIAEIGTGLGPDIYPFPEALSCV